MTKQIKEPETQQSEIEKFYQDTLTLKNEISARLKSGMLTSHDQECATAVVQGLFKIMNIVEGIISTGKEKISASNAFNAAQPKETIHPLDYYCLANDDIIEWKERVQDYSQIWQELQKSSDAEVTQTLKAFTKITFAPK